MMNRLSMSKSAKKPDPVITVDPEMERLCTIRKFGLPDMPLWGPKMLARLSVEHPHISQQAMHGRMVQWMSGNTYKFIRNELSVGVARAMTEELDSAPTVHVFLLWFEQDRDGYAGARAICRDFENWARMLRAHRIRYEGSIDWKSPRNEEVFDEMVEIHFKGIG